MPLKRPNVYKSVRRLAKQTRYVKRQFVAVMMILKLATIGKFYFTLE